MWVGPETLAGLRLQADRGARFTALDWVARLFTLAGLPAGNALWAARAVLLAGFGVAYTLILRRCTSLEQVVAGSAVALAIWILVVHNNVESWYVLWVLPLAAASWRPANVLRLGLGAVMLVALYLFRPRFVGLF